MGVDGDGNGDGDGEGTRNVDPLSLADLSLPQKGTRQYMTGRHSKSLRAHVSETYV